MDGSDVLAGGGGAADDAAGEEATAATSGVALKLTDPNCTDPDLSKLQAGVTMTLCNGTVGTGTYVPPTMPDLANLTAANLKAGVTVNGVTGSYNNRPGDCTGNGQTGCVATATFKSADLTNLAAGNIKSGVSLAGVTGTYNGASAPADCTSNAQVGCVTTTTYKAADLTNLSAGNIKSGVAVAGVTGQYPSSTYPLSGADTTADLDLATFDAKIKSSANFEWFDSAGTRYQGSGDTDIDPANIASGITIFGATGTVTVPTVNAWDLRYGVTVGSTTGALKLDCRSSSPGAPVENDCTTGENWEVLTSGGTCTAADCIVRDRITGVTWTKDSGTTKTWSQADTYCSGLTDHGYSDWRLPTRDELQLAVAHALRPRNPYIFPSGTVGFWTSSLSAAGHFMVRNDTGVTLDEADSSLPYVVCVR